MFNSVDCNDMIVLTCFLCVHVQGDVQGKDTDASMTAFCLIAMQESRTICNDTVNVSTSPPYSVLFCYDQGLGETLVQHENETPLFLFPKHHQQHHHFC